MAFFLNSNFCIFPVDVFGSSQNSTFLGTLKFARVSLQKEISSFSVTGLSLTISINAQGTSPHFSSGFATTAAIDTDGCFANHTFTPTSAGWYWFTCSLLMNFGEAEDEYATMHLYKNGSEIFAQRTIEGVGTMSQNLAFSFMAQANGSGDYFNIYCHHYAGSTREVDKNALLTWWNGFKLIGLS